MFKTVYIVHLEDSKYLNHLIKYHIHFIKIKYLNNGCFLYVDEDNLAQLKVFFEIYHLKIIKVLGLGKYKYLLKKYNIFFLSLVLGILFMYILSNITFDIEIMTNNQEIISIIEEELNQANLKKYRFIKSFSAKEQIKQKLLSNYKDQLEWIEIDRVGCKYYVRLLERVIKNKDNTYEYQSVVAKKNAVIKEIKASSGQVLKKVNDYVNKGDIIISGNIMKKDEVKGKTKALGTIYGETWYTVKVSLPHTYTSWKNNYTYTRYSLNFLQHRFFLFGKGKAINPLYEDKVLFQSSILPISLNKTIVMDNQPENYFYTYDQAENKGMELAQNKLLETLSKDSQILMQKKLKLYEENSKIIIEVFFKVYEDITDYEEIG